MAYIVIAYVVMAYSYGLHSYCLYRHCVYSYSLHVYGPISGRGSWSTLCRRLIGRYVTMAYIVMAASVMAYIAMAYIAMAYIRTWVLVDFLSTVNWSVCNYGHCDCMGYRPIKLLPI